MQNEQVVAAAAPDHPPPRRRPGRARRLALRDRRCHRTRSLGSTRKPRCSTSRGTPPRPRPAEPQVARAARCAVRRASTRPRRRWAGRSGCSAEWRAVTRARHRGLRPRDQHLEAGPEAAAAAAPHDGRDLQGRAGRDRRLGAGRELTSGQSDRVFALRDGAWEELPQLNHPRAAAAAAVVGDKIVVVGGQANGKLVPQTEVFDGERWTDVGGQSRRPVSTSAPPPTAATCTRSAAATSRRTRTRARSSATTRPATAGPSSRTCRRRRQRRRGLRRRTPDRGRR